MRVNYITFANHFGLDFGAHDFNNFRQFDAVMDIEALAKKGQSLNLTVKHNPYKEHYRTIWIKNLS